MRTQPPDDGLPLLVASADWSQERGRRRIAIARRRAGRYRIEALEIPPVGPALLDALLEGAGREQAVFGADFPMGVPRAWAVRAGISCFPAFLRDMDEEAFRRLTTPAARAEEIELLRPFYPARPGGARRRDLVRGLGLSSFDELLRECDRRTRGCAPFWLVGANQVGKAGIAGWRELLRPALRSRLPVAIWPFATPRITAGAARLLLVETYPAWYRRLWRRAGGLAWMQRLRIGVVPSLDARVRAELAPAARRSDSGDALFGLLGMIAALCGLLPREAPQHADVCRIEGWVCGLAP